MFFYHLNNDYIIIDIAFNVLPNEANTTYIRNNSCTYKTDALARIPSLVFKPVIVN